MTRRRIFKEVANLAYHAEKLKDDIEALPYKIVDYDEPTHRESIYRESAIIRERIRLAMGLSLRPENVPVHLTQGLEESNISEKYYEPPLMQVIPSACNGCPVNWYEVTNKCMGCMAEAEYYVHEVATGKLPFLLTSCCPSWSAMAKKFFPETKSG